MPIYPYSFTMPPVNKQDIPSDGVVGEFLGISAGGVLDWLPVAGGGDMLKSENLSGLADYAIARTNIGLGTASTPTFANLTLTSPSLTSDAPVTISQTWNQIGTAFTAFKVNAVSTASAAASLLLDLQVGGVSKSKVDKGGFITAAGVFVNVVGKAISNPAGQELGFGYTNNGCAFYRYSTTIASFVNSASVGGNSSGLNLGTDALGFASSAEGALSVVLLRDGADNTLALRNGAAAQTFNVYGTYTSGTSYERLTLSAPSAANAIIGTNKGSGGGTARGLDLHTDGAARMTITTAGNVGIGTTNPTTPLSIQASSVGNVLNVIGVGSFGNFLFQVGGIYGANLLSVGNTSTEGFIIGTDGSSTDTGSVFRMQTKGIVRSVIDRNGNFGIGTTAPITKLDVVGLFQVSDGTTGKRGLISSIDSVSAFISPSFWGPGGTYVPLHLQTSALTRLAIDTAGNVGIGTTAPGANLHIRNDQGAFTGIYVDNRSVAVGSYSGIALGTNITGAHQWFLTRENTLTARLDIALNLGSPFLSILSAGNVGIGTTSPTSKLQVSAGDVEVDTIAKGVILKSPDGTRYRVTVANGGTLSVAAV